MSSSTWARNEVAATGGPAIDRAVEAAEIVRSLKPYGITQADLAQAMGVSPRTVRLWVAHATPNRTHEARLHQLRQIVLVLRDALTPNGVGQWLRAPNRRLGRRRPLDVCAAGAVDEVLAAAEAFRDGDYV
jgi:predicted DNA-binding protein (UPF0251 family)